MSDVTLPNTIAPPSVSTAEVQGNDEALRDYVNSSDWVDSDRLASGAALGNLGDTRGKSIIATEEARTNTTYATLTTPDQVTGVVVPTDGLIAVACQGLMKSSGTGSVALFLGANQLKGQNAQGGAPQVQEARSTSATYRAFASSAGGLLQAENGAANSFATTGQLVGIGGGTAGGMNSYLDTADVLDTTQGAFGGPMYIFAAAGTYTVSLQFKDATGTVTVKERKLWVWTVGF